MRVSEMLPIYKVVPFGGWLYHYKYVKLAQKF